MSVSFISEQVIQYSTHPLLCRRCEPLFPTSLDAEICISNSVYLLSRTAWWIPTLRVPRLILQFRLRYFRSWIPDAQVQLNDPPRSGRERSEDAVRSLTRSIHYQDVC